MIFSAQFRSTLLQILLCSASARLAFGHPKHVPELGGGEPTSTSKENLALRHGFSLASATLPEHHQHRLLARMLKSKLRDHADLSRKSEADGDVKGSDDANDTGEDDEDDKEDEDSGLGTDGNMLSDANDYKLVPRASKHKVGSKGGKADFSHQKGLSNGTATGGGQQSGPLWTSFYSTDNSTIHYIDINGTAFSVDWNGDNANFVIGKGWQKGSATRAITYTASFEGDSVSYLAMYGWFYRPLVEWYIMDNHGPYDPAVQGTFVGNVTDDGGVYMVYYRNRTNSASIDGDHTNYTSYYGVRQKKRDSGAINCATHFHAWQKMGLAVNEQRYQVMSVEGFHSKGSAALNVISRTD